MTNTFQGISYNIFSYIWYYEIDLKTREKLYEPGEAKDIWIIQIYWIIKYILFDNKYIEGASTMLDPQTCIIRIDAFLTSYILPDLPN